MTELAVRAPTPQDAAGIAEVLNAHAAATGRAADETSEGVARWFELEDLDPAHDMFLAVQGERIMGYADVTAPGAAREVVYIDLRVLPGEERVVERLLEEAERRAAELAGCIQSRDRLAKRVDDSLLRVMHRAALGVRHRRPHRRAIERRSLDAHHRALRPAEIGVGAGVAHRIPMGNALLQRRRIDAEQAREAGERVGALEDAELDLLRIVVAPDVADALVVGGRLA